MAHKPYVIPEEILEEMRRMSKTSRNPTEGLLKAKRVVVVSGNQHGEQAGEALRFCAANMAKGVHLTEAFLTEHFQGHPSERPLVLFTQDAFGDERGHQLAETCARLECQVRFFKPNPEVPGCYLIAA